MSFHKNQFYDYDSDNDTSITVNFDEEILLELKLAAMKAAKKLSPLNEGVHPRHIKAAIVEAIENALS